MVNDYWVDRNIRVNLFITALGLIAIGVFACSAPVIGKLELETMNSVIVATSAFGLLTILTIGATLLTLGITSDFSRKVEIKKGDKK